uniref:Uncharacterized protein n=1 Tax=Aegilops tauschii subsp. strangulata TaxID=200361 RepID=A0A453QKT2_AEGTS
LIYSPPPRGRMPDQTRSSHHHHRALPPCHHPSSTPESSQIGSGSPEIDDASRRR